jgi:hypothetical protein
MFNSSVNVGNKIIKIMKSGTELIEHKLLPVRTNEPMYFAFEDDFVEENIRCIPMITRFKMDIAGIKLKLWEWCKFTINERKQLADLPCMSTEEIIFYKNYLEQAIRLRAGNAPTYLPFNENPAWANLDVIDEMLQEKANEYNWVISIEQWRSLNNLQRFALLKLYRPGHENKNFPKAMKEFKLV